MRLILFRHAKAEKAGPGVRDIDRNLAERGREQAARMGAYMVQHGLLPDLVLVSTAKRTRETWICAAPAWRTQPRIEYEDHLYENRTEIVVDVIKGVDHTVTSVMVIGHNPSLHDVARLLVGPADVEARERLDEGLPTAGLVVIDFAGADWSSLHARGGRLERFVTPRLVGTATE